VKFPPTTPRRLGTVQIGPAQVGMLDSGTAQVGIPQVGTAQVWPAQITTFAILIPFGIIATAGYNQQQNCRDSKQSSVHEPDYTQLRLVICLTDDEIGWERPN
jgi:hypothetical protein